MRLTLTDKLIARTATEGSAVAFALSVYSDSAEPWSLSAPTTIRYRIDDPVTGAQITDWTTVSPASTATITATGSENTLTGCSNRRQLTVQTDAGLSTVAVQTREWTIKPLVGVYAA